jgi:hypothetical protein
MMRAYQIIAVALLFGLSAGCARAQFAVSAGLEYFSWTEDTSPIEVRERGPLFALGLAFTQPKEHGFLFAYRGRFYIGEVDYNGAYLAAPDVPLTGNTRYTGTAQEGQVRYRLGYGLDVLGGLGIDLWQRKLSDTQKEDYRIVYGRLGVESNAAGQKGWVLGAGLKYPLWTRENAHLTDFGFDQNPELKPGKDISVFGQLGYRFEQQWAIIAYLDGFRFTQSNQVAVSVGGVPQGVVFQPGVNMYVVGLKLERSF